MAEIPIERREHRSPLWMWLIGIIAVVLLIWLAAGRRHSRQMAATRRDTASSAGEIVTPVPNANTGAATGPVAPSTAPTAGTGGFRDIDAFSKWISTGGLIRSALRENEYTAGGIRRLADALESQGATGASIDNMRKEADELQNSRANSARHGDMARSAFLSAADAFESLAQARGQLDVSHVRDAADAIRPGTDLLNQRTKVQAFFQSARSALQQISAVR